MSAIRSLSLSFLLFFFLISLPFSVYALNCTSDNDCGANGVCSFDDNGDGISTCRNVGTFEPTEGQDGQTEFTGTVNTGGDTFAEWANGLIPLVDGAIVPLLYAVAFLAFLIGVVRYFFTEGEEGRKTARQYVVWGLVGLVVLFSVWSLVKLLIGILEGDI